MKITRHPVPSLDCLHKIGAVLLTNRGVNTAVQILNRYSNGAGYAGAIPPHRRRAFLRACVGALK